MDFVDVDPIEQPIPIQPTAHYSMGGIPTDADGQVIVDAEGTPVIGFYAAGECACVSVHGANRLGTNSLLEASLFGRRAGKAIANFVKSGAELVSIESAPANRNTARIQKLIDNPGSESVDKIAQELKTEMTTNCGIFRDDQKLIHATEKVQQLRHRFTDARIMDKGKRFNTELLGAIETEHLLTFSEIIVAGALARTESRGAHSRTDYPKRDDENWLKHTMAHRGADGHPDLSFKPVMIFWDRYPPQERKY